MTFIDQINAMVEPQAARLQAALGEKAILSIAISLRRIADAVAPVEIRQDPATPAVTTPGAKPGAARAAGKSNDWPHWAGEGEV